MYEVLYRSSEKKHPLPKICGRFLWICLYPGNVPGIHKFPGLCQAAHHGKKLFRLSLLRFSAYPAIQKNIFIGAVTFIPAKATHIETYLSPKNKSRHSQWDTGFLFVCLFLISKLAVLHLIYVTKINRSPFILCEILYKRNNGFWIDPVSRQIGYCNPFNTELVGIRICRLGKSAVFMHQFT